MSRGTMKGLLFLCLIVGGHMATIGIDLGAEWLKVASVQTGSGIVDIVLNEQSHRKTSTFLGFRNDERFFGDDAQSLAPRFPSLMQPFTSLLLGQAHENTELVSVLKDKLHLPFDLLPNQERGTFNITIGDQVHTAEELWGMWFQRLKTYAEKYTEQPVADAVISVPSSFNSRQRQAVMDAANLANLKVISLLDHTTAAALQYGVQNRGFQNGRKVVIADFGASTLEVGVFEFDPIPETKKKHGDVLGTMHVKSIVCNQGIGGRFMDAVLGDSIIDDFKAQKGVDLRKLDDTNARKAKVKLMRTAQKAKEMLSANKDVNLLVEGMWDEQDFPFKLSRSGFEKLVDGLLDKTMAVVKEAIQRSGFKPEEIDVVELMGGNSRVPLFQEKLKEIFGSKIGRSLNTDEAIAFGAAFHSARLSGGWKVRGFGLDLKAPLNISFQLSASDDVPAPAPRDLFVNAVVPARKTIILNRTAAFNMTLLAKKTDQNTNEVTYTPIDEIVVEKVRSALKKVGYLQNTTVNPNANSSVEIKVQLSESYLVDILSVTVVSREAKTVVPEVANVTLEETNTTKAEGSEATNATSPTEASEAANSTATAKEHAPIRKARVIETKVTRLLKPLPMNQDNERASRDILYKLNRREEEKRKNGEERNKLDQLIYNARYDDSMAAVLAADVNETITKKAAEIEEWFDGEGYDAVAKDFKAKQNELKEVIDVIKAIVKKAEDEKKKALKEAQGETNSTNTNSTSTDESTEGAAEEEGEKEDSKKRKDADKKKKTNDDKKKSEKKSKPQKPSKPSSSSKSKSDKKPKKDDPVDEL